MKQTLKMRRSTKLKNMSAPAPKGAELKTILETAARVPDHGKLSPFYFIVFEGDARAQFGEHLRAAWEQDHGDATEEQLNHEQNRLKRAPLVVAVISRIRDAKIPAWEQILTAGAACYNLCLACNAHGYGTNWLTEWYAYHPKIRAALNLENGRDNIAGFIYIGTETEKQDDRQRPDMSAITNHWTNDKIMDNKGDIYNKDGMPMPNAGFEINEPST
jgi:nitroreductase